jgi:hypothetical protein
MGQQSNKVQKRRRRLNYQKRKKLAGKTTSVAAKPAVTAKTTPAKKPAAKPAPVEEKPAVADKPEAVEKPAAPAEPPTVPSEV